MVKSRTEQRQAKAENDDDQGNQEDRPRPILIPPVADLTLLLLVEALDAPLGLPEVACKDIVFFVSSSFHYSLLRL